MTKDELIELAREGMEMHSPKAPEYIVCAALIKALAQPEPWEKFCDSNCVWTDHHPDCKLAQPEQEPWVCECGADSYLACKCAIKSPPQRKPLTDDEIDKAMSENKQMLFDTADNYRNMRRAYARIIEAAHGIKGEA